MSNCICLFLSFAASCSLASRNESFTRKNPFWGLVSSLIDISGIGILLSPPPQTIKQVVGAYNSLSFRHLIGKVLINPILDGYVELWSNSISLIRLNGQFQTIHDFKLLFKWAPIYGILQWGSF